MKRFDDDFPTLLAGFNLKTLENDPNSIFGLTADLAFNYLNPAWFLFARENDGEPAISERFTIGSSIADSVNGPAKEYYLGAFRSVLETGTVWHHDYECSSPDIFRLYHQSVYPLHNRSGLIVINSLVADYPHNPVLRPEHQPIAELYVKDTGMISQCCNCRRVQRASQEDAWDWVPAWVSTIPENSSHTFCQICFEYYYEFNKFKKR